MDQSHRYACGLVMAMMVFLNIVGCHRDMYDQPKYEPMEESNFFADSLSSRPLVNGVVTHTREPWDEFLATGAVNGKTVDAFPFAVTREVLLRGRERFDIFCSPCHGRTGDGRGMIVQRGFPMPPSFHSDSLRARPAGHFVQVIANGFGRMYSYANRVQPRDRWAITAYIRALQLSRHASRADMPEEKQRQLHGGR